MQTDGKYYNDVCLLGTGRVSCSPGIYSKKQFVLLHNLCVSPLWYKVFRTSSDFLVNIILQSRASSASMLHQHIDDFAPFVSF